MRLPSCLLSASLLVLVAGCPHPRYVVADVTTHTESIRDALVATDCGAGISAARRTGEDGRARVSIYGSFDAAACTVTVAKPGFETIEARGLNLCSAPAGCPPTRYILRRLGGER